MKKIIFLFAGALSILFVGASVSAQSIPTSAELAQSSLLHLTDAQMLEIGKRIWQNQSGGEISGITSWNEKDKCAYIGINECIWYTQDNPNIFQENWPTMALYLKDHGFPIEDWMLGYCPWETKEDFVASLDGPQVTSLRSILSTDEAVIAQARRVAEQLNASLPKMLEGLSDEDAARVRANFERVSQEPLGWYALIDYVNFKGEGTLETERFNGEGWGLLQVLETMTPEGPAMKAFVDAAEIMLKRLISNHPSAARSLPGWEARLQTYIF